MDKRIEHMIESLDEPKLQTLKKIEEDFAFNGPDIRIYSYQMPFS